MASGSSYQSNTNGATYVCPNCNGAGTIVDNGKTKTCPTCHGSGFVTYKAREKFLNAQPLATIPTKITYVTCPECGGSKQIQDPNTGKLIDCPLCQATGQVDIDTRNKWEKDNGAV